MPKEFKFEIRKNLCVLSQGAKNWTKELNIVSWNDKEPKYDLRDWSPDHQKMGKGITLSEEDLAALKKYLDASLP
ncbi:MAG: YdbC family protein [Kiritimatiellae bacterium]|nr:YdbC family protein [Kiritimatiellia bacterium]